jgi:hypothetical protein
VAVAVGAVIVASFAVELSGSTDAPTSAVAAVPTIVASLAVELRLDTSLLDGAPGGSVERWVSTSMPRPWATVSAWICALGWVSRRKPLPHKTPPVAAPTNPIETR